MKYSYPSVALINVTANLVIHINYMIVYEVSTYYYCFPITCTTSLFHSVATISVYKLQVLECT